MVNPFDEQLASRDPSLPCLSTLFDTQQILDLLNPVLDLDWNQAKMYQAYIRYKKSTSCIVGYVGTCGDQSICFYVKHFRPRALDKFAKSLRKPLVRSDFGPGAFLDKKQCLLFMFFPNDAKIKALRGLENTDTRRKYLKKFLSLSSGSEHNRLIDLNDSTFELLRYKPERRCVSKVILADGTKFLLKVHAHNYPLETLRLPQTYRHDSDLMIRPRLGTIPSKGLALYPWVTGLPLCSQSELSLFKKVGCQLATFHSLNFVGLEVSESKLFEHVHRSLNHAITEIIVIAPQLSAKAIEILNSIATLWQSTPTDFTSILCNIHGDFSADQVIVDADHICFIDFDRATVGNPVHDLCSFLARLHCQQIAGDLSRSRLNKISQTLIEGYMNSSPWDLSCLIRPLLALNILKLASTSFRTRKADWLDSLSLIISRIECVLSDEY